MGEEYAVSSGEHILALVPKASMAMLRQYLVSRLFAGRIGRDSRINRYSKTDRQISTWQKLNPRDSEREAKEDNTGISSALPMNLPLLATYLTDATSYFAEALAPISSPFYSSQGDESVMPLLKRLNEDASASDYYGNLTNALKALLKYNVGGLEVDWHQGAEQGNRWKSIDVYNHIYDSTVRNPTDISKKAEYSALAGLTNRLELMRKHNSGEWFGLKELITAEARADMIYNFYCEAATTAAIDKDGQDSRTTSATNQSIDYSAWGLGLRSDFGVEVAGYEVIDMYCWLIPEQFSLLTKKVQDVLAGQEIDPETCVQLWRFKIVKREHIVDAMPADLDESIEAHFGQRDVLIPHYLCWLTEDELKEAQRSFVELQKNFQRFASSMLNIYVAGMRKAVWGMTVVDPSMVDAKNLEEGEVAGILKSKEPGRDVRTGVMNLTLQGNLDGAMSGVESILGLRDRFFPSQQLPSQVAGIDRAVKSQVAAVMQGGSRPLKMILRQLDSRMMNPTRLAAYRNLKRYDPQGLEAVQDEVVSKLVGSGIEALEAERVSEAMWQLLYTVIQNQETMQTFDVPDILSFISRVMNISVDLGRFARKQPQGPGGPQQPGTPDAEGGEPGPGQAQGINPATFGQPT